MKRLRKMLAVLVLASFLLVLGAGIREDSQKHKAYILMEAETGTVLEEENANEHLCVGFLSKLMSLLLVAEDIETGKYSLEDVLTASDSVTGTKGSVVWLQTGDKMPVDELLKSVIAGNANDAVTVLAEASEQTVERFVSRMNSKAFDIGLRDTAFFSPYGYYDKREYSTAHDIAVICSHLWKYEFLHPYFAIWRDFVRGGTVELVNENKFSRTYELHVGFKAVHSDASGYCIAEGGQGSSGMKCISVILGAENADSMYSEAKEMLKRGYTGYKVTSTMFPDEMLRPLPVRCGEETAAEIVIASQGRFAVPKRTYDLRTVVVLPEYASAPLKRGQRVGTAAFYDGDSLIYESPIIVKSDVKKLSLGFITEYMLCKMIE